MNSGIKIYTLFVEEAETQMMTLEEAQAS